MKSRRKVDSSQLLVRSLRRTFGVLTLGLFGGMRGYYVYFTPIDRRDFWQDYCLPSLFLAMLGVGGYRMLLSFGLLYEFNYFFRRAIFALALVPAIFICALGQMKRLRDMGLHPILALVNFIPIYGSIGLMLFVGIVPRLFFKRRH